MNIGERDELLFKLIMTYKRDHNQTLFGQPIKSVGFMGEEFSKLPVDFTIAGLKGLSDVQLETIAFSIGCGKAPAGAKADIEINGEGVSLKSLQAAPPALVNHTARPGFEFACQNAGVSIDTLDNIIEDYWDKRMSGVITEDTRTTDLNCPFFQYREYLEPILEYFLFDGTGSKLSIAPAKYLIEFLDPCNESSYKKLNRQDTVAKIWPKLIFSLRAKKGMPSNYDINTYTGKGAASIARWVRYHSNDYRGALHIRISK
jgi:hypothetical protein